MPPTNITCVSDFAYFLPDKGWDWHIIGALWEAPDQAASAWNLAYRLARGYRRFGRAAERRSRQSVWEDIIRLIKDGWIVRRRGLIWLNPGRLRDPGPPVPNLFVFPEPNI